MTTRSELIRQCQAGAVHNPFQGEDKRVLFVCSMGILRSATGSRIYGHKYNTRSVGTHAEALTPITQLHIDWADEVVFVNSENYYAAQKMFEMQCYNIRVLDIPDDYDHMAPEIIQAFNDQYEQLEGHCGIADYDYGEEHYD